MAPLELPTILTVRAFGSDALRAAQRSGAVSRLRRGAYRREVELEHRWERDDAEFLARCVAVTDRLTTPLWAFSHSSGARLHELPAPINPGRVEIVQRTMPTRNGQGDIHRHHRPDLTESDIVEVHGLPVTRISRTVLDCACDLSPKDGLAVADAALQSIAKMDKFRREESLARQEPVRAEWLTELADLGSVRGVRRAREIVHYAQGLAGSPKRVSEPVGRPCRRVAGADLRVGELDRRPAGLQ